MTKIRRQVSDVFGVLIEDWDSDFDRLNKENRLNSKAVNKLLLVILKRLEEIEKVTVGDQNDQPQ